MKLYLTQTFLVASVALGAAARVIPTNSHHEGRNLQTLEFLQRELPPSDHREKYNFVEEEDNVDARWLHDDLEYRDYDDELFEARDYGYYLEGRGSHNKLHSSEHREQKFMVVDEGGLETHDDVLEDTHCDDDSFEA